MSVESVLSQLNIKIEKRLANNNILAKCFINPNHEDKDPSCNVNLVTGIIHCFGCKENTNIIKVYQNRFGIADYREAEKCVFGFSSGINVDYINVDFIDNLKKKEIVKEDQLYFPDLFLSELKNIDSIPYIKDRGWAQEFIDFFNVKHCFSDNYIDYAIIPIVSEKLNIKTFEARKIFEVQYFQKLLNSKSNSLERFRAKFKSHKKEYKDSIQYDYLIKAKVLYPSGSPVTDLIFNYDNLDFNEDLILVEGLASIPKIWSNITKNVTCCFGSTFTDIQMNLLRKFNKRIILVTDNDLASYIYTIQLNFFLSNICIYDCYTEDTKDSFVKDLENAKVLKANEFIIDRNLFTILNKEIEKNKNKS